MIDTTTQTISLAEETTWFMADPHFGHDNIRKFSKRPFASAEEMNAAIWKNLDIVGENDTLVMLGDVTWLRDDDREVKKLPGKHKILLRGNHDKGRIPKSQKWSRVCDYLEARVLLPEGGKKNVILQHYPLVSWNGARMSFHLHGHTHGIIPPVATEFGGRMDVGVDVWDFKPVRLRDVMTRLDEVRSQGFAKPGVDY